MASLSGCQFMCFNLLAREGDTARDYNDLLSTSLALMLYLPCNRDMQRIKLNHAWLCAIIQSNRAYLSDPGACIKKHHLKIQMVGLAGWLAARFSSEEGLAAALCFSLQESSRPGPLICLAL
jgi:hypothetical protein